MKRLLAILLFILSTLSISAQRDVLYTKLVNALMCVDPQTIEESQRVESYIERQFKLGNYAEVLRYSKAHLQGRMSMIDQMYFAMSEQERADVSILIEGNLIFHYILSSAVHTNNDDIMGDVYDYLLFIKQLQLRTSRQISDAIKRSGNDKLLYVYETYHGLQQQLAQSNPPAALNRAGIQELLNRSGRVLAQQSIHFFKKDEASWRNVQNWLAPSEVAIEFVRFNLFKGEIITSPRMYAAVVVTSTSNTPKLILMNSEKNLTYWQTDNPGDLYMVNKYGAALCQLVWLDILMYLNPEVKNIFFSPFGILNNMAIEALPFDKEKRMNNRYNLVRLSSTREVLAQHNIYPKKTAALYGNLSYRLANEPNQQASTTRCAVFPLPWTKQEIDSISGILSNQKYTIKTFSQKQGTEASFKSLDGKSPSILHIATHGFVNRNGQNDVMQRSGLIMAYGARTWEGKPIEPGTEDGILTAAEIAALDLSGTDIVVLSACNSALGEITSEGVWGLQRAFKQAGVQKIVMSLWQVDDEATAIFMQYLYEELMKHRQAMAAATNLDESIAQNVSNYTQILLAKAQNRMQQHPKYSSPYYWAAFIAID